MSMNRQTYQDTAQIETPGRDQLLRALTAGVPSAENEEQFSFYLTVLRHRLSRTGFQDLVIENIDSAQDPDDVVFSVMAALADLIRHRSHLTLEQLVYELCGGGVFSKSCLSIQYWTAVNTVFIMAGWLTALYSGKVDSPPNVLGIEQESTSTFQCPQQTMERAQSLSLCILLHGFGSVLPVNVQPAFGSSGSNPIPFPQPPAADDVLRVALLNAAHLKMIKKVRIEWTLSLGTHLDFDKTTRCLKVFCMPSILLLQNQSANSLLSELVNNFHDEHSRPEGFSYQALVAEILFSYSLLFRNDAGARKVYKKQRRAITELIGAVDPVLDRECGFGQPGRAKAAKGSNRVRQESFRKSVQFPILGYRLTELQAFAREEGSNRFWRIVRDKSDTKEWLQFVVIVIFGAVALFLAAVNTVLSVVQVVYTVRSYKVGQEQREA